MSGSLLPSAVESRAETQPLFKSLHKEIDRVFDEFRNIFPTSDMDTKDPDKFIVVNTDVRETDELVEMSMELPGVEEKDLDISVAGNVLTIKGEKSSDHEETEKDYKLMERKYGSFVRTLPFSFDIDEKKVSADFENGVLKVTVKKPPEAVKKSKKINISKTA